ncbi:MAG TPA: hypothetical protein PLS81_08535 [Deltaproteobacteria bacterium]|nr:hypothetical protein [Deltaproteobacteria bacterium]HOM29490.1 hypothetical protein [Deltaproteobacteria bacterium]HPP80270.1 hypothetical protein [Deltaproteobacteria bacterium]
MDDTAITGFIETQAGLLHDFMSSPPAKDMLRLALKDIDPESGRRLVRTLMTTDPEVPLAVAGSLPRAANLIIKALLELATLVRRSYPAPLLTGFVGSLLEEVDRKDLALLRSEIAFFVREIGPVVKAWLESLDTLSGDDPAEGSEKGGRP